MSSHPPHLACLSNWHLSKRYSAPLKKLPRHVPTVWPFPSKNSRKVFLTTGAVHFTCLLVIVTAEVRKYRIVKVVVVVRVLRGDRVDSVL
jgi:hypothetical protein